MQGALCRLDELQDPGSASFVLGAGEARLGVVVVRRGAEVWAYVNSCPHIGVPLDFEPGRVLDLTRTLIQCSMHGARFRMEDGVCISGPCAGKALQPFPIALSEGWILPIRA